MSFTCDSCKRESSGPHTCANCVVQACCASAEKGSVRIPGAVGILYRNSATDSVGITAASEPDPELVRLREENAHLRKTLAGLHDLHAATAQGITNAMRRSA